MSEQRGPQDYSDSKVVAGVDGSRDGLRAVEYASRAALVTGAHLHLVHAVDDAVMAGAWGVVQDAAAMEQAGRETVEQATARAIEMGLPPERVHGEVTLGNATSVLAKASEGALRLIVGRRRLSGLERMFVGSTSASLAAVAHCPLVVISAASNPEETRSSGVVAVGVDSDGHSDHTLAAAHREAKIRQAKLLVTHVQHPVPVGMFGGYKLTDEAERELLAAARQAIDEMVARVIGDDDSVPLEVVVDSGDPVDRMVELSRDADLLVLGMRPPRALGIAIGGLTRAVMAHAEAPLMVVHP